MVLMGDEIDYGKETTETHNDVPVYKSQSLHIKRFRTDGKPNNNDLSLCGVIGEVFITLREGADIGPKRRLPICRSCLDIQLHEE